MDLSALLAVGQTALELGLICSLTVLALFLSYSMLNVCDLSTDGCFTLGAAVPATRCCPSPPPCWPEYAPALSRLCSRLKWGLTVCWPGLSSIPGCTQ